MQGCVTPSKWYGVHPDFQRKNPDQPQGRPGSSLRSIHTRAPAHLRQVSLVAHRQVSPVCRTLLFEGLDQKIYKGPNFGLGVTPRRVQGIHALDIDRQLGNDVFDQSGTKRFRVEVAWQERDAQPADGRVQQGLTVIDRQTTTSA